MVQFRWNEEKNLLLKQNSDRAICIEDIVAAIESGGLLDDVEHINASKYPSQRMYIVLHNNYVYSVPYVRDKDSAFLKTIYPSRKLTAMYLKGKDDEN
jgi:hypothetical protein